jgi:hypothetical protein
VKTTTLVIAMLGLCIFCDSAEAGASLGNNHNQIAKDANERKALPPGASENPYVPHYENSSSAHVPDFENFHPHIPIIDVPGVPGLPDEAR